MSKLKIKMDGDTALKAKLKGVNKNSIKTVVKKNTADMFKKASANATAEVAFKKGYTQGETRTTMQHGISPDGMTGTVRATTAYAPYVEYGTRYMEAEPFMKPAFDEQKDKFVTDLKKLIKD